MAGKSLQKLLEEVDQKKAQLDSYRPLPGYLIKELNQWFNIELAYSSNALEGSSLTNQETRLIIEKDLPTEGKSLREHFEAVSHATAFEYIMFLAQCRTCDLTFDDVLNINKLLFNKIEKEHLIGKKPIEEDYKHILKCPKILKEIVDWVCGAQGHPILVATQAHFKIIALQPFARGNGITARLLMNLILLQKGYEPAIIWPEDGLEYARLLGEAIKSNNLDSLYSFIAKQVIDSFDLYLSKVQPPL